ncbi:hypothetical protein Asp14428_37810 [Actinoplanes sp. NBRC 14428]|uniref:Antibiotic biosynthesis monooxygenase n=1 Tax=Pseudosporangium ferrugineum TaxID=439699 RepID=A0A2T0RGK8_9ACTN|nr:hypothetical protein [Pseudosporangium ferrugineum]PRY20295.1 hypothetical protein CLV70_1247 [Pseudosporangium ferrugineum]BCJ52306.1 hypothetical protein Asp14428_37810 [Actinoplanes sp. NBRC 14428]
MIARMWEVRASRGGFDELLSWVIDEALPTVEVLPSHVSSEVYSSTDLRIVVISKWRNTPAALPAPPENLIARSPHVWDFTPVDR